MFVILLCLSDDDCFLHMKAVMRWCFSVCARERGGGQSVVLSRFYRIHYFVKNRIVLRNEKREDLPTIPFNRNTLSQNSIDLPTICVLRNI